MSNTEKIRQLLLAQHWQALCLRGVMAFIFGILVMTWPAVTEEIIIILFGLFAFTTGLGAFISSVRSTDEEGGRLALFLQGLAGLTAGIITFAWPAITAEAMFFVLIAWLLITGAVEIMVAIRLPSGTMGRMLFGVNGLISILFGIMFISYPADAGIVLAVWVLGAYAVITGTILITLSLLLRSAQKRVP